MLCVLSSAIQVCVADHLHIRLLAQADCQSIVVVKLSSSNIQLHQSHDRGNAAGNAVKLTLHYLQVPCSPNATILSSAPAAIQFISIVTDNTVDISHLLCHYSFIYIFVTADSSRSCSLLSAHCHRTPDTAVSKSNSLGQRQPSRGAHHGCCWRCCLQSDAEGLTGRTYSGG